MDVTATVTTSMGAIQVALLDGTTAHVNTLYGDPVQVRRRRYTVSARFELSGGRWVHNAGHTTHPVQYANYIDWNHSGAAPTVAATVIDTARAALEALLADRPGLLADADLAAAQHEVRSAQSAAANARRAAQSAIAALEEADGKLAAARSRVRLNRFNQLHDHIERCEQCAAVARDENSPRLRCDEADRLRRAYQELELEWAQLA